MSYKKINKAVDSGLLDKDMCEIVAPPSSEDVIALQDTLNVNLSNDHVELLQKWGGSILDIIRINGLDKVVVENGYVEFASDYNGFVYKYDISGAVCIEDTDGGKVTRLSESVSSFLNDFVFGVGGEDFYGEKWVEELKEHGLA